jgi:hypothetical protein
MQSCTYDFVSFVGAVVNSITDPIQLDASGRRVVMHVVDAAELAGCALSGGCKAKSFKEL